MSNWRICLVIVLAVVSDAGAQPPDRAPQRSPDGLGNLALLPGVHCADSSVWVNGEIPFRQIGHLKDGRYGNDYSWIPNSFVAEWAQIELAEAAKVDKTVREMKTAPAGTPGRQDRVAGTGFNAFTIMELLPEPGELEKMPIDRICCSPRTARNTPIDRICCSLRTARIRFG